MAERRPGLGSLPANLLRPTAPPESASPEEQPDDESAEGQGSPLESKPTRRRSPRRPVVADKTKGRKISLPDDIHDRLQLLAFQKRSTISAVTAEILDRNLPRFRVEREG